MDIIGRKKGLILSQVISLAGWIIVCAAFDVSMICIGRFICGIAAASTALIGKQIKNEYLSSVHLYDFLISAKILLDQADSVSGPMTHRLFRINLALTLSLSPNSSLRNKVLKCNIQNRLDI